MSCALTTVLKAVKNNSCLNYRVEEVANMLISLYTLFITKDATMVEINPFAEDSHGNCKTFFLFRKTVLPDNTITR